MKLLREYIRELLREEPGRSYHTPNMDPMDVMEQEGFRVSSYIDINSGNSHVTIEQYNKKTDQWDEVYEKVFENAEEAMFWMNNQAQIYQRKKFSQDVEFKPDGP